MVALNAIDRFTETVIFSSRQGLDGVTRQPPARFKGEF
jgi:hypothetical protein